MVKTRKKQKVRFHKGDKRPGGGLSKELSYTVEMIKEGRKILWHVIEDPSLKKTLTNLQISKMNIKSGQKTVVYQNFCGTGQQVLTPNTCQKLINSIRSFKWQKLNLTIY
jgi:hypothetical protein